MTTKEKILNAALTLFSEKGYNAVSVRHIAAEVGIKASSLYNHFENKQDILHELVEKNIKYINDFIEKMDIENLFNSDKFTIYVLIIKLHYNKINLTNEINCTKI